MVAVVVVMVVVMVMLLVVVVMVMLKPSHWFSGCSPVSKHWPG